MQAPIVVSLILALMPVVAIAADEWHADPPGVWRKMTWEDETTTSKCIGQLTSPLCAVETKLAGHVRKQNSLVVMALADGEGRTFVRSTTENKDIWEAYRFSGVRKVTARERIPLLREDPVPGDYLVDLHTEQCFHHVNDCQQDELDRKEGPPTTHLVRKIGKKWRIITWNTPPW